MVHFICCLLIVFFFFFKQKTAYEMLRSLVGSEMCIRDRYCPMGGSSVSVDPPKMRPLSMSRVHVTENSVTGIFDAPQVTWHSVKLAIGAVGNEVDPEYAANVSPCPKIVIFSFSGWSRPQEKVKLSITQPS